jgi:hypothetical protein
MGEQCVGIGFPVGHVQRGCELVATCSFELKAFSAQRALSMWLYTQRGKRTHIVKGEQHRRQAGRAPCGRNLRDRSMMTSAKMAATA